MNMLIVVATGEPRGAYHLHPLRKAAQESKSTIVHLTPYPEPVQGEPWLYTSHDTDLIKKAAKVVIIGGGFTAWTTLVAESALSNNKKLLLTELAIGAQPDNKTHPNPHYISALSPISASNLAEYHKRDIKNITITGTPLLDNMPIKKTKSKTALIFSTVSRRDFDTHNILAETYNKLQSEGYKVIVRPHPREDTYDIRHLELDTNPNPIAVASTVEIIFAYPGTPLPIVAALETPIITLTPTKHFESALPPQIMDKFRYNMTNINQLNNLLKLAKPMPKSDILSITGPIGKASQNVIKLWDS